MITGRLGVVVAGVLALTLRPPPAHAYVRYSTASGNGLAWGTTRVELAGYPQGVPGVAAADVSGAFMRSVATWTNANPDLDACSTLDLHYAAQPASATVPAAAYDRTNNIVIRADTWCPVDSTGAPQCHDPSALAITSVFSRACGELVDADIELNAVNFAWANLDASPVPSAKNDLQNALTHEMGHFIGLDHPCDLGSGPPQVLDNNGAPVPACASAPDAVRQTTMFPSADLQDVSKRTLAPDDIAGVCGVYPTGAIPKQCPPTVDAGADATDGGTVGGSGDTTGSGGSPGSGGSGITSDAGTTSKSGQGCGCALPGPMGASTPAWLLLALAFLAWPRRRGARHRSKVTST